MKKDIIIPKLLGKEPLVEAVCELRFKSDKDSVADLLPGMIFQKLSNRFSKVEKLPASNLPIPLLKNDPSLFYTPTTKLRGDSPFSIMTGEHVLSISCVRPYEGWNKFSEVIMEILNIVKETSLITNPQRISLKYIDILPVKDGFTLDDLDFELQLGGKKITKEPLELKTEIDDSDFINLVQITTPARAVLGNSGKILDGLVIDIDTISKEMPVDFWTNAKVFLDKEHAVSKSTFFNILKPETIKNLEPEY